MKNFALLNENNIVINIAVAEDNFFPNGNWIEYTEDNPAFIGGDYLEGYFYYPQPYPSWSRNKGTWQAPKEKPEGLYSWDEDLGDWVKHEA
jgi:hypothetical protein